MKTALTGLLASLCFIGSVAYARPHLALNSTEELQPLLQKRLSSFDFPAKAPAITPEQQAVLDAGERVYAWINLLNLNRQGQAPLSYSNPGNMSSPTVSNPKIYDASTGLDLFSELVSKMPESYRQVVLGSTPLPSILPIPEDQFLEFGLKITNAYDITARWILMQDWLYDLAAEKVYDLRGYVFLRDLIGRDAKLAGFRSLPVTEQNELRTWLLGVCLNGQLPSRMDLAACQNEVQTAVNKNGLIDYCALKNRDAKMLYDSFFMLSPMWIRSDIVWNSKDPATIHYPFLEIADPSVAAYFKNNVEDEFKGAGWKLSIDFTNQARYNLSHLEYQPNTTAHAEPNKIVMDEFEPRTEYLSQWTIRHEFGHLLGFRDCYVEFYDSDIKKIVNYPLDPTNLMCSRRGNLQPQHFDVLRARYYKP